jgi:hypothetical protein
MKEGGEKDSLVDRGRGRKEMGLREREEEKGPKGAQEEGRKKER